MKYRPLAMHVCFPKYVLPGPPRCLPGPGLSGLATPLNKIKIKQKIFRHTLRLTRA